MERTTNAQIETQLKMLNKALGTPVEMWSTGERGRVMNVGNIHMESTGFGGYRIAQVTRESGITRNLGAEYRMTKGQVWITLRCMLDMVERGLVVPTARVNTLASSLRTIRAIGYATHYDSAAKGMLEIIKVAENAVLDIPEVAK